MQSTIAPLTIALAGWLAGAPAVATELLRIDFEQGDDLSRYERLDWGTLEAAVAPREAPGQGHCLCIHNSTSATSCGVRLEGPVTLTKNLLLSFDYRMEIEPGFEGAYLGMIFYVEGKQWFWHSDVFSAEWRHAEVSLGSLPPWQGHNVRSGLVFSGIQLYGRVKDKTPVKGETKARMTIYLGNIHAIFFHKTFDNERLQRSLADFRKFTGRSLSDYCAGHMPKCFLETLRVSSTADRERRLWQPSRHPEAIQSEKFWRQKLDYLHENPCKKGLITRAACWRFSSAAHYVSDGREACDVKKSPSTLLSEESGSHDQHRPFANSLSNDHPHMADPVDVGARK